MEGSMFSREHGDHVQHQSDIPEPQIQSEPEQLHEQFRFFLKFGVYGVSTI